MLTVFLVVPLCAWYTDRKRKREPGGGCMMKKWLIGLLLVILVCLCASALADVKMDSAHFPDPVFRLFVRRFDTNADDILSDAEIAAVSTIDCSDRALRSLASADWSMDASPMLARIASLEGIQYFTSLTELDCSNKDSTGQTDADIFNRIPSLDLSGNVLLSRLDCSGIRLSSLTLNGTASLLYLDCRNNLLTELDLSGCPMLLECYCSGNALATLDLDNASSLVSLDCSGNQLAELDVSHSPALLDLCCSDNRLSTLILSGCSALERLNCAGNLLSGLDIQTNASLRSLDCRSNHIRELALSGNAALTNLDCSGNELTALNTEGNELLHTLFCRGNNLRRLDLSKNTNLEEADCGDNQLTDLIAGGSSRLTVLRCGGNRLAVLDLSACTALRELWCQNNQLTDLSIGARDTLDTLICYNNRLTAFPAEDYPKLAALEIYGNRIKEVDVTSCTAIHGYLHTDVHNTNNLSRRKTTREGYDCFASNAGGAVDFLVDPWTTVKAGWQGGNHHADRTVEIFDIEVLTEGAGTASASEPFGTDGTEIILSAQPDPGWYLTLTLDEGVNGWYLKDWQVLSGNVSIVNGRFRINGRNVSVQAVFAEITD